MGKGPSWETLIYSSTPQKARKRGSGTDKNVAANSRHEAKPSGSGASRCHVQGSKHQIIAELIGLMTARPAVVSVKTARSDKKS